MASVIVFSKRNGLADLGKNGLPSDLDFNDAVCRHCTPKSEPPLSSCHRFRFLFWETGTSRWFSDAMKCTLGWNVFSGCAETHVCS